ncbi:MAG: CotH kinase family protein [Prolixibacteraceae bacterium]
MNRVYIFIFIIMLSNIVSAQDFYDMNTVQTIKIVFSESNWDALLDAKKSGDESYLMAQSVSINEEVFDSVGVKYKGNSTYKASQKKNPFHIELDTYKDQDYDGYTDIKLSNVANDPSFVREVLSYQILRQYMDAPLSNYANVYVNGTLIGLYSSSEAVSKTFVKSHFGSKKNAFIKCNPPDGAGPGTSALPNLVYLGTDSSKYYSSYELQSDNGWNELINLCDTLTNKIEAVEKILDVDRALWMLAFDNALVNLDSYIGAFSQNYYLYRDDNGRFLPVVWDLNESFGRFSQAGTTSFNSTADKQKMSHLINATSSSYPLVKMLLSVPMYKRMYLAHLKTMMLENFDNQSYYTTGKSLQATIDAAVQADVNKFFTYANFTSNLTNDITSGMGPGTSATPGITKLMDGRSAYLLGLADFTNTSPSITDISLSDASPLINSNITVSGKVNNASAVYLGYRSNTEKPFTRIQMYDDGTHSDQTANDGIFSTSFNLEKALTQYYIYAENSNTGIFSPQRAEHEYYTISATTTDLPVGDLVINEFMASNQTTIADQDGEYNDWIEIYNNTTSLIDLSGYTLSDDAKDLIQWEFPAGTTIDAGGYLIVWADKDEEQTGLHANFKLSSTSGQIFLSDAIASLIDEVSYSTQTTDISYGRSPNGTGNFQTMASTFNGSNLQTNSIQSAQAIAAIKVYPNPATNYFYISGLDNSAASSKIVIYNTMGRIVFNDYVSEGASIDASQWTVGIYIVKAGNSTIKMMIKK